MPPRPITFVTVLAILYFVPGVLFFRFASGAEPKAVVAGAEEPGERLQVSGTVYGPDGETPAAGVEVYVYQTDAEGLYSETNDNTNPRLTGSVLTDSEGRYSFETIRPGHYPGGGTAAHIHYVVSGGGYPKQYFKLRFEGDPYLTSAVKARSERNGKWGSIRQLEKNAAGTWNCTFDLRLRR